MGDSRLDLNSEYNLGSYQVNSLIKYLIFVGSENRSAGRGYGVYEPNPEFLSNIDGYLHNRFLNIGIFIIEMSVIHKYICWRFIPSLPVAIQRVLAFIKRNHNISRYSSIYRFIDSIHPIFQTDYWNTSLTGREKLPISSMKQKILFSSASTAGELVR